MGVVVSVEEGEVVVSVWCGRWGWSPGAVSRGESTCGMTMMHLYPLAAHTIASAMPVLPG